MLQNEDTSQTSHQISLPAAQARVTPEALAAALTRLEARKEADQRQREGTVPIGEVIEQLGFDATPEEVLAEVQRFRAKPRRKRDYNALACAIGCLLLLIFDRAGTRFVRKSPDAGLTQAETDARYFRMHIDNYTLVQTETKEGPVTETLQELPDGQLFQCDLHGANRFTGFGKTPNTSWNFLKHQGKIYICGWSQRMSARAFLQQGITVYRQAGDISSGVQISLPLDGFIHANPNETEENPEKIQAVRVTPDKHLWDNFDRVR